MREEDLNPYDLYEVAQAQRERAGGLRAVRGILGPRSDDEEPPEITIRRGRGDSDAELYEYMRGLWPEEKKDNARLKAELAAIKARRCETCRFRDERGWCEINARTYPGNGFCSEWEAANADS